MNLTKLVRQLNPTGRAFKVPNASQFQYLHDSLNTPIQQCIDDIKSIYNQLLPDNLGFTLEDTVIWENRLGLPGDGTVEERNKAISRRLNHPNNTLGRMAAIYLEGQLQAAGFNVFIHANKFDDGGGGITVINPGDGTGSFTQHGPAEHGVSVHGSTGFQYESIIGNHVDKSLEITPSYSNIQLRATFFIGAQSFPTFATVPARREEEFRKLILTLKGQHLVGFLLINYTS